MLEAGIERARAVIACVDSDAENIFATLTSRELRPDIPIVARAAVESSERKLIRAGANEVVSPYKASGRTMASLALIERDDESSSAHMRDGGAVTSRRSATPIVSDGSDAQPSPPPGPVEQLRAQLVEVAAESARRGVGGRRAGARAAAAARVR